MIINWNECLDHSIKVVIEKIEEEYSIEVLFCGLIGSRSINLHSNTSDRDFRVIYRNLKNDAKKFEIEKVVEGIGKVEFYCFEISMVLKESVDYSERNRRFPTYEYRKRKVEDVIQSSIFILLSSPEIWDSGYIKNNIECLQKTFIKLNILDYFFTRAKGNFENFLSRDKVQIRKYLYTLHQIYCIKWILNHNNMPPFDFSILFSQYSNNEIENEVREYYKINRYKEIDDGSIDDGAKVHGMVKNRLLLMTNKNEKLNKYIEQELEAILKEIEDLNDNSERNKYIELNINSKLYDYINKN